MPTNCMNTLIEAVDRLLDSDAQSDACWDELESLLAPLNFSGLRDTPQNPVYHGEGDVMAHTRLVCQELCGLDDFRALNRGQQELLLLAALLHDIGKQHTTRLEDGKWRSPNHAIVGSKLVREFLWRECDLCGTPEDQRLREYICSLVRHHMIPARLVEQSSPERTARRIATVGELVPAFTWEMLSLLSRADVRGRISKDIEKSQAKVESSRLLAEEAGCLHGPFAFADARTKRAYFTGKDVNPDQAFHNDTWGEVVLMCGLPGTGKDTWIAQNLPDLPMISLDGIRCELAIDPTDKQERVVREAHERANRLLKARQPFVWNATNTRADRRGRLVSLCEDHHASVRIVYLETGWQEELKRNGNRDSVVPLRAIKNMLGKLEPPMPNEADVIEWHCV